MGERAAPRRDQRTTDLVGPSAVAATDRLTRQDAGPPPPPATLADVARRSGVSIATASRAISGRGPVAPSTRARVMAAALELDFSPSATARSLRTHTSGVIGFVIPDVSSSFYANALKGAQHRLQSAGYHVALMDTDEAPERELAALRSLAAQGADGLIVCTSGVSTEELREAWLRCRLPIVFFDNVVAGLGDGGVALANESGVRVLVDHLVGVHGHRRIGYVGGLLHETSGIERLAGFTDGLAAHGIGADVALLRTGDWTHDSGRRETLALLDAGTPEAIVYASGQMALGGLAALRARGLRVPADVAVVSFDDWEAAALLDPPITALVRQDRVIGDLAALILLRVLEGEPPAASAVRVPMSLIVRRSCGCEDGATGGSDGAGDTEAAGIDPPLSVLSPLVGAGDPG